MADISAFLETDFLIAGFISAAGAIILTMAITRDMNKMKLVYAPVLSCLGAVGFYVSPLFLGLAVLLFVLQAFSTSVISNYIVQIVTRKPGDGLGERQKAKKKATSTLDLGKATYRYTGKDSPTSGLGIMRPQKK